MDTSDLAKRMKNYESISKTRLMKRCPVICRIDGKSHHNFTRGFNKPFDEIYIKSIQETAKYLCENLQGVAMSYQQSDEITLVFVDYKELNTTSYFDYEVQKLCSIIASMATMAFNKFFTKNVRMEEYKWNEVKHHQYHGFWFNDDVTENEKDKIIKENNALFMKGVPYLETHRKASDKGAMFDARVFSIPKEEVTNCIYWRQLDASRNSIQMVGQANFSHKELQNKSCNDIQDMLMTQKGFNWNDLPTYQKRGSCCIKEIYYAEHIKHNLQGSPDELEGIQRTHWIIDKDIPIFKGEGREYIENLIMVGE